MEQTTQKVNGLVILGFLLAITQEYGYVIEKTGYDQIARQLSKRIKSDIGYAAVRRNLHKLAELGYAKIDNPGTREIRFTLIKNKVDSFLETK